MKRIKSFINDIYGSNANEYWKDEGNNKKMRSYAIFAKILSNIQQVLILLIVFYLTIVLVQTFKELSLGICHVKYFIQGCCPDFMFGIILKLSIILMILVNILFFRYNDKSKRNVYKNLLCSLLIFPFVLLLNYLILGQSLGRFLLLIMFIVVNFVISAFIKKIMFLQGIVLGNQKGIKIEYNKGEKKK